LVRGEEEGLNPDLRRGWVQRDGKNSLDIPSTRGADDRADGFQRAIEVLGGGGGGERLSRHGGKKRENAARNVRRLRNIQEKNVGNDPGAILHEKGLLLEASLRKREGENY